MSSAPAHPRRAGEILALLADVRTLSFAFLIASTRRRLSSNPGTASSVDLDFAFCTFAQSSALPSSTCSSQRYGSSTGALATGGAAGGCEDGGDGAGADGAGAAGGGADEPQPARTTRRAQRFAPGL
jgi:hypothetical protein